jgi:cytochrome c556
MIARTLARRAGLACAVVALAATAVSAQTIIENRIANFRDMGSASKNIADELRSGHPNRARVQTQAKVIRDYGQHLPSWFPANSRPVVVAPESPLDRIRDWITPSDDGPGATRSHARPEIWTRQPEFRADAARFQTAADLLWRASATGDAAQIAARHKALTATCDACHTTFRTKLK